MSEQNVNSPVAAAAQAIKLITDQLTNGELHMKSTCKELGWSFPRIRSRALTLAKKMNCTLVKVTRGVYILDPIVQKSPTAAPAVEPPAEDNTTITSDALVEGDGTEDDDGDDYTLDPDAVEAALLDNTPPTDG